jgi:hypothetical protein
MRSSETALLVINIAFISIKDEENVIEEEMKLAGLRGQPAKNEFLIN